MYQSRWERDKSGADAARGKAMRAIASGKVFATLMTCAAMGTLAGCKIVSDPPKVVLVQDVEFLRGCWVAKTMPGGEVTGFLRLLPEGAHGLTYQGYLQVIANGQQSTPVHLSFARDGSSITVRSASGRPVSPDDRGGLARPHSRLPDAVTTRLRQVPHRASYSDEPGQADSWIVAEGGDETLAVYVLGGSGGKNNIFRGERDGCD